MQKFVIAVLLIMTSADVMQAQSGGFVATLGVDTVHIERFERAGNRTVGTIVMRTPSVRIIRWSMTMDERGRPAKYVADAVDGSGAAILDGYSGSMTFMPDSVVRQGYSQKSAAEQRMAAPNGVYVSPVLPYIGTSYTMYELAYADAKRRAVSDSQAYFYSLTMVTAQAAPSRTRAWLIGADSAELDYFGRARSGYKFDAAGHLLRADWTATTYQYRINRVSDLDVEKIATAWSAEERAGRGVGALSPRDSVHGSIDTSHFTIDYGRPAKRGRKIWGGIVPNDRVWRLGADMATHFTTSADLMFGSTVVPAGRYTLWMIPSDSMPTLVVSSSVNVFGTNYDPRKDFARIPLRRTTATSNAERLTMDIRDGVLSITWDDARWIAPVKLARP